MSCEVSLESSKPTQPLSGGPESYWHPLNAKGISFSRRNKLFWKNTYSQLCGVSLQSSWAAQPILGVASVMDASWAQRASPAGGPTNIFVKNTIQYHVRYTTHFLGSQPAIKREYKPFCLNLMIIYYSLYLDRNAKSSKENSHSAAIGKTTILIIRTRLCNLHKGYMIFWVMVYQTLK